MKRSLILLGLLVGARVVQAQTPTVVSATISDSRGNPYSNAAVKACLTPAVANPTVNGSPVFPNSSSNDCFGPITASSSGSFAVSLYANALISPASTRWVLTISTPGISVTNGGFGPVVFSYTFTIAGSAQNLTSALSAIAPPLAPAVVTANAPANVTIDATGNSATNWLLGGNTLTSERTLGTLSPNDVPIIAFGNEVARFPSQGYTRLIVNSAGNTPTLNEGPLEVFGYPIGLSNDQIVIHGTNPTANRRGAIMFDSRCKQDTLTHCVDNGSQVNEFEVGVDLAPNGNHNFFIQNEISNNVAFFVNGSDAIGIGTSGEGVLGGSETGVQGEVTVPRLNVYGQIPSCAVTGAGNGATCSMELGSTDTAGTMLINTGGAPAALGTITLFFKAPFGANVPACVANLFNDNDNWNPRATVILNNRNPVGTSWNWDNNSATLFGVSAFAYGVSYICIGK